VDATPLRVVTLKLYDTYGPGDRREKLFTLLARASTSGSPLPMSPGDQLLELVHVDDACDAFLVAGERLLSGDVSGHESYAVPAQRRYTLREVVEVYCAVAGRKVDVVWGGRPYRPREVMVPWQGSPLPGWRARIALPDGLRTMLPS
jgi:nucleoside-diphosphate-sugar epimerase